MKFFKYLFCSLLLSGSLFAGEAGDGWFPVEKTRTAPADGEEIDSSIWVLFAKSLGEERITVRLPEDPSYAFSYSGAFEVSAKTDQEIFELKAIPQGEIEKRVEEIRALSGVSLVVVDPPSQDSSGENRSAVTYKLGEKWVHEHLIQTAHHLYCLQTIGESPESADHLAFISSFQIENKI